MSPRLTLSLFHRAVGQRACVFVERFSHEMYAKVFVGKVRPFANGHFNCLHGLENRGIVFPSMVKRPHVLSYRFVQAVLREASTRIGLRRVVLFRELPCLSTED